MYNSKFLKKMATLAEELGRAAARKDKVTDNFTGEIRSTENGALEIGDVLVIPNDFKGSVHIRDFNGHDAQYIFCAIDGTDQVKAFYPSTFTKFRIVYKEDGTNTRTPIAAKGTAVNLFKTAGQGDVAKGMGALKGKKIKVTNLEEVLTKPYGRTELAKAYIPTIDLVEE